MHVLHEQRQMSGSVAIRNYDRDVLTRPTFSRLVSSAATNVIFGGNRFNQFVVDLSQDFEVLICWSWMHGFREEMAEQCYRNQVWSVDSLASDSRQCFYWNKRIERRTRCLCRSLVCNRRSSSSGRLVARVRPIAWITVNTSPIYLTHYCISLLI